MTGQLNSERAVFPKTKQRKFLLNAEKRLALTSDKIAKLLKIHPRTFSDWKKEKFSMSFKALKKLSDKARLKMPSYIEIREPFWYTSKGGKIGGPAVFQKYGFIGGNPERRKLKWKEWWNQTGKFIEKDILKKKPIKTPKKNTDLAEFIGIVIGDGSISKRQITITSNYKDEKKYCYFIIKLCNKLFGVMPTMRHRKPKSTYDVVVSRTALTDFLTKDLGLKIGSKTRQQIDIPKWIQKDKKLSIACLRGLVDTDGSIITHKYKSKNKYYSYKKIGFTNRSRPVLEFVNGILNKSGIKNRFMGDYDIRIENKNHVKAYFNLVKTHNPKHWQRYIE